MFKIGDFSKIAQVSGRLLRYYDEIGLLSPDHIDGQTGYRYYSAGQLSRLNRILALKGLGLSLDQVARLLDESIGAKEIRDMLTERKTRLERSLREEADRLRSVESRIMQLEAEGHIVGLDVVEKSIPAFRYLSWRQTFHRISDLRRFVDEIRGIVPTRIDSKALGAIIVVVHAEAFDTEEIDCEVGYALKASIADTVALSDSRNLAPRMLAGAETMATIIHSGNLEGRHIAYGTLGNWIEGKGYRIGGAGREVLLQLPSSADDGAVVEIQLPIEKQEPEAASRLLYVVSPSPA